MTLIPGLQNDSQIVFSDPVFHAYHPQCGLLFLLIVSVTEMLSCCSQFPALEDFYLVVCRVCNKVVTPQGILTHYGEKHSAAATPQGKTINPYMHM